MKVYPLYRLGLLLLVLGQSHLSFALSQEEQLTVNAATTDVASQSQQAFKEANKLAEIFQLQKQLVYKLLQNIGIRPDKLSPTIKNSINQPQTTSLPAFEAYCNCLDLFDRRLFREAREQCNEAVRLDHNFFLARQLRDALPEQEQTMAEIVAEHMGRSFIPPLTLSSAETPPVLPTASNFVPPVVLNTIPPDRAPVEIPSNIGGEACQTTGSSVGCQVQIIDKSSPACNSTGRCGFYSTFLAQGSSATGTSNLVAPLGGVQRSSTGAPNIVTAPYMNRVGLAIPPNNASGVISINQIGQEGNGSLTLQVNPAQQTGTITAFQEGLSNQGNKNIATANGQLDRVVTNQFQTQTKVTGLELGMYLSGFGFNTLLGNANGGQGFGLFQGVLYFAEGQATPIDTIKNLGRVDYSGVANGDFSVNGQLVPCQGTCGHFNSTLNYGAATLENFSLTANARQVEGNQTAAAQINANNVAISPNGSFQFNQTAGSFQVGTTPQNLTPAVGNVAGQPFGNNAEIVGGVFSIHNSTTQGAGNFGGNSSRQK